MTNRVTRPLIVFAAFARQPGRWSHGGAVALGGGLLGGLVGKSTPASIGGPFQLTDQTGQTVTEKDLVGRPTIIFFGYTHCPDVCPTSLFEMSEVLRAMGKDADRINAYFVTVDPERDTQAAMKEYLSSFDPHLKGLTGDAAAVGKIVSEYRVFAKKIPLKDGGYSMDHTALIYLMDRDGHFVSPFNLSRSPEAAAADLKRYL